MAVALRSEFLLNDEALDELESLLEDRGCVLLRTPGALAVYFEADRLDELRALLPIELPTPEEVVGWERAWQSEFSSETLSPRITVSRPDVALPGSLLIDPGLTFGYGAHPSSRLILSFLEEEELSGRALCEVGCGSGILSLAAAKFGASPVVGTDIDPEAVRSSGENAALNGFSQCQFFEGSIPAGNFDYLIMNIISSVQREILPGILTHLNPGATLLLSGILAEESYEAELSFGDVERRELEGWAGFRVRLR